MWLQAFKLFGCKMSSRAKRTALEDGGCFHGEGRRAGAECDDVQTKAPRINGPSFLYVLAKANQAAVLGLLRQLNSVRP
jgi:hypothetical protein